MSRLSWLLGLLLAALTSQPTFAHEVKPAYLELAESGDGQWQVLWKMPIKGGIPAPMEPAFPTKCHEQGPRLSREATGAIIQRWQLLCDGNIEGERIAIDGLQHSMTDALVRVTRLELPAQTARLTPRQNSVAISPAPTPSAVAQTYFVLGIEHILLGIDHLLFVFALLLIVVGWRNLLATITAFTVAHSITLSAASLGAVRLPQAPVEAVIALSILFLAAEIVRAQYGQIGLSYRKPWLVAFVFGLLHGFGFAGALSEIGLPPSEIPLALLSFNVGVEAGQLLFVAGVMLLSNAAMGAASQYRHLAKLAVSYGVGSVAMFWTIERVASFYT
ncbi:HupE/UreJ family protein [Microbulbifer salipaludis]|uniref:HupE/UreJ family protein n=1 Tax=Microbulbifer salipaludis TaxID=187980 RepID=A0ABS3E290_9GAMM|nr:HupE/UreJ family protein [Microbulbifer salipaludis]MBN8429406.1 HupE/UreJ family protein [Microbulbifer salipaludis]